MPQPASYADQREAFGAVQIQGKRCFKQILEMKDANRRIAERAQDGDAVWSRVAAIGYDQVCRHRNCEDVGGLNDSYLAAIRASDDLKVVCDTRYYLGQTRRVLVERIDLMKQAGILSAPYDDFARAIHDAITGVDRSPSQLAEGIEWALSHGRIALDERLRDPRTRLEKLQEWAKNNTVTAVIIFITPVLLTILAAYNGLPDVVKDWLGVVDKPAP